MHCACQFEEHKQSSLSANCKHTFPIENHKQYSKREGYAHARATSADSFLHFRCNMCSL